MLNTDLLFIKLEEVWPTGWLSHVKTGFINSFCKCLNAVKLQILMLKNILSKLVISQ